MKRDQKNERKGGKSEKTRTHKLKSRKDHGMSEGRITPYAKFFVLPHALYMFLSAHSPLRPLNCTHLPAALCPTTTLRAKKVAIELAERFAEKKR